MFATGSDFDRQISELGPAFFSLCLSHTANDLDVEYVSAEYATVSINRC